MSGSGEPSPRRSYKVPANGQMLHVVEQGGGVPILLVHGWMGSSYHWRHVMPLLAQSHRVVAIDCRGYGDSDKPYDGYDGETIAEDLRQVAETLRLDRPIVIGHDMGALPALLFAAGHPEAVRGLVYVDEPLPGYNLDSFTAFNRDNPFVYWWFSFNAQPHLPALMWAGKEAELVEFLRDRNGRRSRCPDGGGQGRVRAGAAQAGRAPRLVWLVSRRAGHGRADPRRHRGEDSRTGPRDSRGVRSSGRRGPNAAGSARRVRRGPAKLRPPLRRGESASLCRGGCRICGASRVNTASGSLPLEAALPTR